MKKKKRKVEEKKNELNARRKISIVFVNKMDKRFQAVSEILS